MPGATDGQARGFARNPAQRKRREKRGPLQEYQPGTPPEGAGTWAKVPSTLAWSNLPDHLFRLYIKVQAFDWGKGAFPSAPALAGENVDERTVRLGLDELERLGLIRRHPRPGQAPRIECVPLQQPRTSTSGVETGGRTSNPGHQHPGQAQATPDIGRSEPRTSGAATPDIGCQEPRISTSDDVDVDVDVDVQKETHTAAECVLDVGLQDLLDAHPQHADLIRELAAKHGAERLQQAAQAVDDLQETEGLKRPWHVVLGKAVMRGWKPKDPDDHEEPPPAGDAVERVRRDVEASRAAAEERFRKLEEERRAKMLPEERAAADAFAPIVDAVLARSASLSEIVLCRPLRWDGHHLVMGFDKPFDADRMRRRLPDLRATLEALGHADVQIEVQVITPEPRTAPCPS